MACVADGEGFAPPSAFAQPVFGTGAFAARPPIRGGTCGARTRDLRIRNPTLYPLSYDAFWRRMQDLHLRGAFAPYGLATRRIRLLCQSSVAPPLKGGVACLPPAHDSLRSIERLPTRRMKNGHRAFDAQRPSSTDMKKGLAVPCCPSNPSFTPYQESFYLLLPCEVHTSSTLEDGPSSPMTSADSGMSWMGTSASP